MSSFSTIIWLLGRKHNNLTNYNISLISLKWLYLIKTIHKKETKDDMMRPISMVHQLSFKSLKTLVAISFRPNRLARFSTPSFNFCQVTFEFGSFAMFDSSNSSSVMDGTHLPRTDLDFIIHSGQICWFIASVTEILSSNYTNKYRSLFIKSMKFSPLK